MRTEGLSCREPRERLRLCARVPLPGSPFVLWHGEGSHLPSPSRQIKAEQWDAVQACLDKQPTAKAALGTQAQGTAKPWIRRRSYEYDQHPRPRASVNGVRGVRGKEQDRFPGRLTLRLPCFERPPVLWLLPSQCPCHITAAVSTLCGVWIPDGHPNQRCTSGGPANRRESCSQVEARYGGHRGNRR